MVGQKRAVTQQSRLGNPDDQARRVVTSLDAGHADKRRSLERLNRGVWFRLLIIRLRQWNPTIRLQTHKLYIPFRGVGILNRKRKCGSSDLKQVAHSDAFGTCGLRSIQPLRRRGEHTSHRAHDNQATPIPHPLFDR